MKIIYFWLHCILLTVCRFSVLAISRGYSLNCFAQASHCRDFSCQGAQTLDSGELSCCGT